MGDPVRPFTEQPSRLAAALSVAALISTSVGAQGSDEAWEWEVSHPIWIHVDALAGNDDSFSYGLYSDSPIQTVSRAVELLSEPGFPYADWSWFRIVLLRGTFRQAANPLAPLPWEETFPLELPGHLAQLSIEAATPFGAALEVVPVLSLDPVFVRHAGTDLRFKNLRIEVHNPDTPFLSRPLVGTDGTGASGVSPLKSDQLTVFDRCHIETSGAVVSGVAWEPGMHRIALIDTEVDFSPAFYTNPFVVDLLVDDYATAAPTLEVVFQRAQVLAGAPMRIRRWSWVEDADIAFRAYNSDFRGYSHYAVIVEDSFEDLSKTRFEVWHCAFRAGESSQAPVSPRAIIGQGELFANGPSSIVNTLFRGHDRDIDWKGAASYPAELDLRGVASDASDLSGTSAFVPVSATAPLFFSDALGDESLETHLLPGAPLVDAGVWPPGADTSPVDRSLYGEPRIMDPTGNATPDIGPDEAWPRRIWLDRQPKPGEAFLVRICGPLGELPFIGIDLSPMPDEVPALQFDPAGKTLFLPPTWWTGLWIDVLPPPSPIEGTAAAVTEKAYELPHPHPDPTKWPNPGQWLHLQAGFIDPVTGLVRYSVNDAVLFASE